MSEDMQHMSDEELGKEVLNGAMRSQWEHHTAREREAIYQRGNALRAEQERRLLATIGNSTDASFLVEAIREGTDDDGSWLPAAQAAAARIVKL